MDRAGRPFRLSFRGPTHENRRSNGQSHRVGTTLVRWGPARQSTNRPDLSRAGVGLKQRDIYPQDKGYYAKHISLRGLSINAYRF